MQGNMISGSLWLIVVLFILSGIVFTWEGFNADSINDKFLGVITMAIGGVFATGTAFFLEWRRG